MYKKYWIKAKEWWSVWLFHSTKKLAYNDVANTISSGWAVYHPKYPRKINTKELQSIWSYPLDYNFLDVQPKYLIWMSVPPLMMYKVSNEIYKQRLSKIQKI